MSELVLKREVVADKTTCRVIAVLFFIIMTALGSFVRIPLFFTPVPLTLQTFFVLLAGAFLGRNLGVLSQLGYILIGVIGLPVFSGAQAGLLYLFGPTGGYLFGFMVAAIFIGQFIHLFAKSIFSVFCLLFAADLIILFCGAAYLAFLTKLSFAQAVSLGVAPFIAGDLLKASAAAGIFWKFKNRAKEILG